MPALQTCLNMVFFQGKEDMLKYIVPIGFDRAVPSCPNNKDASATYIGYIVLNTKRNIRVLTGMSSSKSPVKQKIRLAFMGAQSEIFANSTLVWDERVDVQTAFEKMEAQLDYDNRELYTRVVEEHGFNNEICWIVDLYAHSFYTQVFDNGPWIQQEGLVIGG